LPANIRKFSDIATVFNSEYLDLCTSDHFLLFCQFCLKNSDNSSRIMLPEMTEDSSDSDVETWMKDPYCDDPLWEPWHANAIDVQGGADDDTGTSSGDEVELARVSVSSLTENCVCQRCRNVYNT
jgi:hypothetical protein